MGYENRELEDAEDEFRRENQAKHGEPVDGSCPNCGRARLVKGYDDKQRCTECAWCVEDRAFDDDFAKWLFT